MTVTPTRYRFTVEEEMSPIGDHHASVVARISHVFDRGVKLLYARAGVVETWLVDLGAAAVEVDRQPAASGYAAARVLGRGEAIVLEAFPQLTLRVDELLG